MQGDGINTTASGGSGSATDPVSRGRGWRLAWRWVLGLGMLGALVLGAVVIVVHLFPERALREALRVSRGVAGLSAGTVVLPDGSTYAYLDGGRGEPLVLLHGFGGDKDNFAALAPYLTPHFRLILPDHLGFGESSKPADADYGPPAQAQRLRAFVEKLGLGRIHLGGNSMGGQIAIAYAARHSNEVASLWLLSPAGVWSAPRSELLERIERGERNPMLARNETEFADLMGFVAADPPALPRPLLRAMARKKTANLALEERILPRVRAYSVEDVCRGLQVPTLIVWGRRDRVLHVDGAGILAGLMPRSRVILLPEVGHVPMLEAPGTIAADYLEFQRALQPDLPSAGARSPTRERY